MEASVTLNAYQQAIELILSLGHTVLQVFPFNTTTAYYYLVHQFTASQQTPTDDIQYNQVIGINITRFIQMNSFVNQTEFLRKFELFINSNDSQVTRMEFPNTMRWFKFGSAVK